MTLTTKSVMNKNLSPHQKRVENVGLNSTAHLNSTEQCGSPHVSRTVTPGGHGKHRDSCACDDGSISAMSRKPGL